MPPPVGRSRINSVDLLRGLVMVIMLIDHTRDFVHHEAFLFDPADITKTYPALFFTRWITHFCAPVFVLLAGTGTYFQLARGKSRRDLSRFLITRGLWLILLEFTVIRLLVFWNLDYASFLGFAQVIWVFGWSMILLAGLIYLPVIAIAAFGITMIALHNLLDAIRVTPWQGPGSPVPGLSGQIWMILHQSGVALPFGFPGPIWFILYPLVPWLGVMAAGYALGAVYDRAPEQRRQWLMRWGLSITIGFLIIRATNIYGDPGKWSVQKSAAMTVVSFLDVQKYPPSLLFLMEIFPAYEEARAIRIEFWGDTVEAIREIDPLRGTTLRKLPKITVYPASHYVTTYLTRRQAMAAIEAELSERLDWFRAQGKLLEAQRLEERTRFDLEMMKELGYCHGIENYSRHLTGRAPGEPPPTLLDYLPRKSLVVIDESHITVPQLQGMYRGDQSRKKTLVDYGFRLPSALDNRPLCFEEFEARVHQLIYVSATPAPYEMAKAAGRVVEQIVRPTGLMDPKITVKPATNQVDDLLGEIRERVGRGERVLVTTLTKRMAEDLTEYYQDLGLKVRYLHSDITTLERMEILRDLRLGVFDILVGINLLREGLDLPEVSLVAILDADKEGFLRSDTSLIQTIGRAARHVDGRVLMYADKVTDSMRRAIDETNRRRKIQVAYNEEHHIVPASIVKAVRDLTASLRPAEAKAEAAPTPAQLPKAELARLIKELEKQMKEAAQQLEFEKAALLRDQIFELREALVEKDGHLPEWEKLRRLEKLES